MDLLWGLIADKNRHRKVMTKQVLFYPHREQIQKIPANFLTCFDSIWNNESFWANHRNQIINQMKYIYGY